MSAESTRIELDHHYVYEYCIKMILKNGLARFSLK